MVRVVKLRSLEDPRPTLKPVPPEPLPLQSYLSYFYDIKIEWIEAK